MTTRASGLPPPASQALRGALLAALAMCLFSVQDAFVKYMSESYSVVTILFLRSIGILPLAAWLLWRGGGIAAFRTRRWGLQLLRGVLLFLMFLGYYLALTLLPLATAVALVFSAPLMTCLLSVPILQQPIGWHRLGAVLLGFAGVLIMVRPGSEAFGPAALLCLGASFCYALSMVLTHHLGATESLGSLVFYPNLVFLLGAGLLMPSQGTPVSLPDTALILGLGGWTLVAHFAITQAYRIAPPPLLAPFDYTTLVWALLWGWLIWNDWPNPVTLLGAGIVILAGLYVVSREAQQKRGQATFREK